MPVHDLDFSPDGKTLVVASSWPQMGAIHVIDVTRGLSRLVAKDRMAILNSLAFPGGPTMAWRQQLTGYSPDAARVATGGDLGCAMVFDSATGQPAFFGPHNHSGPFRHTWSAVGSTTFSPDGRRFATASLSHPGPSDVRLHDAETGRSIGMPVSMNNYVSAMAFSPDGKILAAGDYDSLVHFWDAQTGNRIGEPLRQPDIVLGLAFRPDGKVLAVSHSHDHGGRYGTILWDLETRRQIGKSIPEAGEVLAFSPDGRTLLTGQWLNLHRWDGATAEPVGTPTALTAQISSAAYRRDGRMIAVGCIDGTLQLCDGETAERFGTAMIHPARVSAVAFSPDPEARLILAGYIDGSARLWDRASQKLLGPPVLQSSSIKAVTFLPDGRSFLTTSHDGTTRRWPVPEPANDDVKLLALELQVRTGLEMSEEKAVVRLSPAIWHARRQQLRDLASPARQPSGISDVAFHEARARDAEQDDDSFAARWHLDRLVALQPERSDKWLTYARRARQFTASGQFKEAEQDYARARKLGSAEQLLNWYRYRIHDCLISKQWQSAQWYVERVLAVAPDDWHLYADRALINDQFGRLKEWEADLKRAVAHGADSPFQLQMADNFARKGMWTKARLALLGAGNGGRLPMQAFHHMAATCVKAGDRAEYRRLCALLIHQVGEQPHPYVANLVVWVCALGPGAVDDYSRPIALAESALREVTPAERRNVLNTLGAVLYRAGRYREAIARLHEAIKLAEDDERKVHDWAFLAMAHQSAGEPAEARKYRDLVTRHKAPANEDPWNKLDLELFRSEVEAVVK